MRATLCSWMLTALFLMSCDFGNKGTSENQPVAGKTCAELSDAATCLKKGASTDMCAYNYSTGTCIKAPNQVTWPEQAISAGADYACAVDSMGDIRCWFGAESSGLARISAQTKLENIYHPTNGKYQTVSAIAHAQYELLTATNDQGQVLQAGWMAGTHKDLQVWSAFNKNSSMAFSGYYNEFACSIQSDGGHITCAIPTGISFNTPQTNTRVYHASNGSTSFCIIDDKQVVSCHTNATHDQTLVKKAPAGSFYRVAVDREIGGTACAIKSTDHKLFCWSFKSSSPVVGNMPADLMARHVAVSNEFAVAIDTDGKLHWWGNSADAKAVLVRDEIAASGQGAMLSVISGTHFACAVKKDATPICFGDAALKTSLAAQGSFKIKLIDDIQFP